MSAPELTGRQHAVLELVERGYTDKDIAEQLRISVRTVRTHLEAMYEHFEVHTRTALVRAWHETRASSTGDVKQEDGGAASSQ